MLPRCKKLRTAILLTLALATVSSRAFAQEIPESFAPVRPMGVGGAFTAIANDENTVWTNPAGLNRGKKPRSRGGISFRTSPNLVLGANTASREFIQGVNQSSLDASQISDQADSLASKPFWASTSIFPLLKFRAGDTPNLAGVYSYTTLQSVVDDDNTSLAKTSAVSDLGAVYGMAFSSKDQRLSFGITGRYVARYAYEEKILLTELKDAKTLQADIKDKSNRSTATAVDLGFLWTVADFWFPTIGISVLNAPLSCKEDYLNPFSKKREKVCGTVFKGDFENPEAISTVDPTDIRVGLSITPRFSSKLAARIALDAHHLPATVGDMNYGLGGIEALKLLHAGIEFFVGNPLETSPFTIAMGMNQGFFTFGTTVSMGSLAIEFATYGKDISTTSSPKEDRRMQLGLSFEL